MVNIKLLIFHICSVSVPESDLQHRRWKLKGLQYNRYIKLDKFVMDVKGFYPYINELVNDVFKFKPVHIEKAQTIFNRMNPTQHTMVSIHVRLTDMDKHLRNHWKLENAPEEYYGKAMLHFHERYKVKRN